MRRVAHRKATAAIAFLLTPAAQRRPFGATAAGKIDFDLLDLALRLNSSEWLVAYMAVYGHIKCIKSKVCTLAFHSLNIKATI